jgi:peptide/nickel transport system ATP-binding protein
MNRFKMREVAPGQPPSLLNPPSGCRFHPRCPYFMKGKCEVREPPLYDLGNGRRVACYLMEDRAGSM